MRMPDDKLAILKAATSRLVHMAGGPDAASLVCRASVQVLYEYQSVHRPDRVIPCDVALQLESYVGEPVVTGALARIQGFTIARPEAAASPEIGRAVGMVAKAAGAVASALLEAQADNHIDAAERADMARHLHTVRDATDAALAGLAVPALRAVS